MANPTTIKCKVPALLGIPLMIVKVEPLRYQIAGDDQHFDNQPGTYLTVEPDSGLSPFLDAFGPCVVFRADYEDFTDVQMNHMFDYLDRLMDAFGDPETIENTKFIMYTP